MIPKIDELRNKFSNLNTTQKAHFIKALRANPSSDNPEYTEFLKECEAIYDAEVLFGVHDGSDSISTNESADGLSDNSSIRDTRTASFWSKRWIKTATIASSIAVFIILVIVGLFFLFSSNDNGDDAYYIQANVDLDESQESFLEAIDINLNPDDPLTRAQYAMLIIRALGETPTDTEEIFHDVPIDSWANVYVTAAVQRGIIFPSEYGESLGADDPITREEANIWTARALGIGSNGNEPTAEPHAFVFLADVTEHIAQIAQIQNSFANFSHGNEETIFHYVFRSDVAVINQPPTYSVTETENTFG